MSVINANKYAFAGLCLALLLTIAGCDAKSDPKQFYPATGSWQGTIGADRVRGIVAPDNTCHLAIVDASGAFDAQGGEYIGRHIFIDEDNLGYMTLTRLQGGRAGVEQQITFKLSAERLFSLQGIDLSRTLEANGPAFQNEVAGRWSLSAGDITAVEVGADGTFSGSDGETCNYSGALQLLSPAWNIYSFDLTFADYSYLSCPLDTTRPYHGLAARLASDDPLRPRLWFATSGGTKTVLGEWVKTFNAPPEAPQITILGERADHSLLVQQGAAVELDAQVIDANRDMLTYAWSGLAPDGVTPLNIQGTGSTVTFVPLLPGEYTINLTVSDGIASTPLPQPRKFEVVWTPDRFIGCGNGTVLDTRTNLLWLQDAWCVELNGASGVNTSTALSRINALAAPACGLNDGSSPGEWRWPTVDDFRQIVALIPFRQPPALLNNQGTGQWIEGVDAFTHVGTPPPPAEYHVYTYWSADSAPSNNWYFVNFNYSDLTPWVESSYAGNINPVWPVRAFRASEQCPPVP